VSRLPSVERLVAGVLLVGGILGIGLVALGLALYAGHGGFHQQALHLDRTVRAAPSGVFTSLRQVLEGLRRRPVDPLAVGALGLVLLMATPGVAAMLAIPAFVAAADYRFATIAALVLTMLLLSLLLAGAIH
jgi:uncharacterized membrane protein